MRFTIIGVESIQRVKDGVTSSAINLYLQYQSPSVAGFATRTEYFGESSPVYSAVSHMMATNINGLLGGQISLDYDVISGRNGSYKKLLGFEIIPKK